MPGANSPRAAKATTPKPSPPPLYAPGSRPHEQQFTVNHQRLQQVYYGLPDADQNRRAANFRLRFLYGERGSLELGYADF